MEMRERRAKRRRGDGRETEGDEREKRGRNM